MPHSYTINDHYDAFVRARFAGGGYDDVSDVIHEALRLLEQRERTISYFDEMIAAGMTQIIAGDVREMEPVFDELETKYQALAEKRGGK